MTDYKTSGIYQTELTYQQNLEKGPHLSKELVDFLKTNTTKENQEKQLKQSFGVNFLGFELNNPLGVAAGPLLDSRWVSLASQLNYSLITYKTIRPKAQPSHPLPNVLAVKNSEAEQGKTQFVIDEKNQATHTNQLTITNSFGMPSQNRDYLESDIPKAKKSLRQGQELVVSVAPSDLSSQKTMVRDFCEVSEFVQSVGADAIELNFSCPNVSDVSGILYKDITTSQTILKEVMRQIKIPFLVKVGLVDNANSHNFLEKMLRSYNDSGVGAVCGINSLSAKVYQDLVSQKPALGDGRLNSGVCGYAILDVAVDFVKQCKKIITQDKLDLKLVGVGGVMEPQHFDAHLQSGADIVQTATGMMWQPFLAIDYLSARKV